jgi:hypothetical protein
MAMAGSFGAAAPPHQERPFEILTPQATPLAHASRDR